jgi:hypothetical protein
MESPEEKPHWGKTIMVALLLPGVIPAGVIGLVTGVALVASGVAIRYFCNKYSGKTPKRTTGAESHPLVDMNRV